MLPNLGLPELLLILLIVVLLFGVNKIPRLGRGLGEGIRNFKESLRGKDPAATPPARTRTATPRGRRRHRDADVSAELCRGAPPRGMRSAASAYFSSIRSPMLTTPQPRVILAVE